MKRVALVLPILIALAALPAAAQFPRGALPRDCEPEDFVSFDAGADP